MIEIVKINWVLMAAHAFWIVGASIILALLTTMQFSRSSHKVPIKLFGLSVGMIVLGILLLSFKIPTSKLLVSRITGLNEAALGTCDSPVSFPVNAIKMDELNGRHERNTTAILDNTLALFYDGFLYTPLLTFKPGEYVVGFNARGTKALDEYATIKVEFEKLEGQYLIPRFQQFMVMTSDMKKYEMKFPVKEQSIGRIRISFVNDDLETGGKKDRNVWIKDINITKITKSF